MKFKSKIFFANLCAVFTAVIIPFSACFMRGGEEKHYTAFNGTPVTVQARNKSVSATADENIRALLSDLNAEFSATVNGSTVFKINNADAGEKTEVSERFISIAEECKDLYEFTGGKFDPSVYPLTLLWQFAPNFPVPDFTLPNAEKISETKAIVGYDKFDFTLGAVKTLADAKLDFGGALKGYAADKIAEILKADGVTEGFISVGGSSIYILATDALSITHPREDKEYILSVKIKETNLSVSTSGDYEKVYALNGKYYSHIIDPETGCPAESGVASVTIIGKNGLKLDALTTATCVYKHDFVSPENGDLYKFIKKIINSQEFSGAQVFAVCAGENKKQILTNKKQGEDFTLRDSSYEVISVI